MGLEKHQQPAAVSLVRGTADCDERHLDFISGRRDTCYFLKLFCCCCFHVKHIGGLLFSLPPPLPPSFYSLPLSASLHCLFLLESAGHLQLLPLGIAFPEWVEVALFILHQGFAPTINNNNNSNNNSLERTVISSTMVLRGCHLEPPSGPPPCSLHRAGLGGSGEERGGGQRKPWRKGRYRRKGRLGAWEGARIWGR